MAATPPGFPPASVSSNLDSLHGEYELVRSYTNTHAHTTHQNTLLHARPQDNAAFPVPAPESWRTWPPATQGAQ